MELPEYKIPSLKRACFSMLERAKAYIIKAATIILVCNCVVQLMQTFNWQLPGSGRRCGRTLPSSHRSQRRSQYSSFRCGFGVWQLAAAAITGFIAKENVVGTLAVVYCTDQTSSIQMNLLLTGGAKRSCYRLWDLLQLQHWLI